MAGRVHYGQMAKKFAQEIVTDEFRKLRTAQVQQAQRRTLINGVHQKLSELIQDFDGLELADAVKVRAVPRRDMLLYALPGDTQRVLVVFTTEWKQSGSYDPKDPDQWYLCIAEFRYPYEGRIIGKAPEDLMAKVARHLGTLM